MKGTGLLRRIAAVKVATDLRAAVFAGLFVGLIAAGQARAATTAVRCIGALGGVRAEAVVSYERLPRYVVMAGRIRSRTAAYSFQVDLVGTSGYGTIVDHGNGTRWRIKVQLNRGGFVLISNPFRGATSYSFRCR